MRLFPVLEKKSLLISLLLGNSLGPTKQLHSMGMHTFLSAPSVQYFVVALSSIFFLVDPFAAIPAFLVITADTGLGEHRRLARKAALTCFIVLSAFALAGSLIFRFFGITLPAFEIARGHHSHPHGIGDVAGAPLSDA